MFSSLRTLQGDIYFTSSSGMIHTTSSKTPTTSNRFSHLTKLPKNIDKKDLNSSGRYSTDSADTIFVYKISIENMTGRGLDSGSVMGSTMSLHNSSSEESVSKTEVISIISSEDGNSDGSTLDIIHPEVSDEDIPSFTHTCFEGEESPVSSPYRRGVSLIVNSERSSSLDEDEQARQRHHSSSHQHTTVESNGHYNIYDHITSHQLSVNGNASKSSSLSPPHSNSRLKRSRKVITGRKSLDAGSRWLNPSSKPQSMINHRSSQVSRNRYPNDMPEILGMLENVVYSSPESEDLSPSDYDQLNIVVQHT